MARAHQGKRSAAVNGAPDCFVVPALGMRLSEKSSRSTKSFSFLLEGFLALLAVRVITLAARKERRRVEFVTAMWRLVPSLIASVRLSRRHSVRRQKDAARRQNRGPRHSQLRPAKLDRFAAPDRGVLATARRVATNAALAMAAD